MDWCNRKVVQPIKEVVSGGITPWELGVSVGLGTLCGLFPVPGVTTAVALICSGILRFLPATQPNPVIVTVVNLLLTVPDVLMVPYFVTAGEYFFPPAEGTAPFSMSAFSEGLGEDMLGTLIGFQGSLLRAIGAWLIVLPFAVVAIAAALYPLLYVVLPKAKDKEHDA